MARPKTNYPKENTLFLRVDPELKEYLQNIAESKGLSLSGWARQALIEKSGFKKTKKQAVPA